eukprot:761302-Hanusia_phi.AAC.1
MRMRSRTRRTRTRTRTGSTGTCFDNFMGRSGVESQRRGKERPDDGMWEDRELPDKQEEEERT